jgi:hypothetical protein
MWFMETDQNSPKVNLPARRVRHDGWTAERQEKFLKALASCGCITDACRVVGMSRESAHNLYNDPRAKDFRAAFDAALDCAMPVIETSAWERVVKGVARPIFYQGEQVGEYRQYNDRLTMFLLRYRRPHRYGAHLDRLQPPPVVHPPGTEADEIDPDEAIGALEFHLGDLIDQAEPFGAFAHTHDGVNFANFVGDCDEDVPSLEPPE